MGQNHASAPFASLVVWELPRPSKPKMWVRSPHDAPFPTTVLGGGACLLSRMRKVRSLGREPITGELWAVARSPKPSRVGSIPTTGARLKRESDGLGGGLQTRITWFNSKALLHGDASEPADTSPCEGEESGPAPERHPRYAGIVQWQDTDLVSRLRRFDPILPAPIADRPGGHARL